MIRSTPTARAGGPARAVAALLIWTLLTLAAGTAAPAAAQEQGRIVGQVVGAVGEPLNQVQVYLVGTQLGTLTNAQGRYIILNVPAGTYQVRAERIGFKTLEREVAVTAGAAAQVNLQLEEEVLGLDEIVVTGTAGQARRREIGNSIAQISLERVAEPVANLDQLLQSRAAGMVVTESAGMAGAGSQIRLRGSVSVSQSNQPLIYIDGIRVRSEPYKKNVPPTGFQGRSGNITASPLSDISPEDIERIEVIKGSAATTLFGTEAAAGVIQVFTKRGRSGAPRWTLQVDQGFNRLRPFSPAGTVNFGTRADGSPDVYTATELLNLEPYIRDGWRQGYAASVTGGGDVLQYYASGSYDAAEGVLPLDEEKTVGVRGNFTFTPLADLQVAWNTSYTRKDIQNTPAGNNAHGLTLNAYRQERNYFGSGDPEVVSRVLDYDINSYIDRFITGGTATYSPSPALTNRLTIGYDLASQENRNLRNYGFVAAPNGIVSDQRFSVTTLTFDYVGSYRRQLLGDLAGTLSFGGQTITTEEVETTAMSEDLPGPGNPTVSSGAIKSGFEDRLRVISAGLFGQALFDYDNTYFLTLGARVDGYSTFGEDLGLKTYPKVSFAYVVSEEEFWPDALGTVKLRAAYGQSGRAPGAFDAVRTWNAPGFGGQPAFLPRNLGNAKLGPEVTAETEVGFDGAFFDGRLATEFTYYHQVTSDALFSVRRPPSEGFATSQLENVGEIRNTGIELGLNATVLSRADWGVDLGGTVYTNESEVVSLGGASEFGAGGGWIKEGEPVMAIRGHKILNPHEITDTITQVQIERNHIYGPQQPTLVLGGNAAVRMPFGIELFARGEYQAGAWIEDGASQNALQRAVRWPSCLGAYEQIVQNRAAGVSDGVGLTAWEQKLCRSKNYQNDFIFYPKDFFKLREVTLRVPVDFALPMASSASLTLSARNWYTWKHEDFLMFDPEMVGNGGFGEQNTSITEHVPPSASFVASLRVVF